MPDLSATAIAHPNIAFIKYWGNEDGHLRIPSNSSLSMNLGALLTRTTVTFDPELRADTLNIADEAVGGPALHRVSGFLSNVRRMARIDDFAAVRSENSFPTGAGIASSASAFAALSLAASAAAGLSLSETELSRLARRGSGSACRSVPGGFVEWQAGEDDLSSYAFSVAPADHWNLVDCIAIVSRMHKTTGSTEGHTLADTSPLQKARVRGAPDRLERCRQAILDRDFARLAEVVELDCNLMHAVMMTSHPPLLYWQPATLEIMHAINRWRADGLAVCYTIDAGPNVHAICTSESAAQVEAGLRGLPGVEEVITSRPGGPARLVFEGESQNG